MPLIATDRNVLLNRLESDRKVEAESGSVIKVLPNPEAQRIFRALGSLVRDREFFEEAVIEEELFRDIENDKNDKWVTDFRRVVSAFYEVKRKNPVL